VIGDAVNVASRVEGLTKSLGADVLVSETTWVLCTDRFGGRRLAAEEIRGRREPVVLFAVDG
jgi:adenylate cyclase